MRGGTRYKGPRPTSPVAGLERGFSLTGVGKRETVRHAARVAGARASPEMCGASSIHSFTREWTCGAPEQCCGSTLGSGDTVETGQVSE